jgi:SAM-dependent methyltransferase
VSAEVRGDSAQFDRFASSYDSDLAEGIGVSGEDKFYFVYGRLNWLQRRLGELGFRPSAAMEFGCGTGSNVPPLVEVLGVDSAVGVDVSSKSLEFARSTFGSERVRFLDSRQYQPAGELDLAFCNGVFHHIPPSDRPASLRYVYRSLKAGGIFALWENNPWNPGTRYVMSRIPFDRDAVTLSAPHARRLLKSHGFEVLRTDFLFMFPRRLSWLRPLEPALSRLPLGAQYQVLARRPYASLA